MKTSASRPAKKWQLWVKHYVGNWTMTADYHAQKNAIKHHNAYKQSRSVEDTILVAPGECLDQWIKEERIRA